MQDRAANAVMVTELVLSHVSKDIKMGVPLSNIGVFKSLPAFMNTAGRALKDLINEMPEDIGVADVDVVLKAIKHDQKD